MSICAQARSRRKAAVQERLGPKTGRVRRIKTSASAAAVLLGGKKAAKMAHRSK